MNELKTHLFGVLRNRADREHRELLRAMRRNDKLIARLEKQWGPYTLGDDGWYRLDELNAQCGVAGDGGTGCRHDLRRGRRGVNGR